jgi:hypothetical protein
MEPAIATPPPIKPGAPAAPAKAVLGPQAAEVEAQRRSYERQLRKFADDAAARAYDAGLPTVPSAEAKPAVVVPPAPALPPSPPAVAPVLAMPLAGASVPKLIPSATKPAAAMLPARPPVAAIIPPPPPLPVMPAVPRAVAPVPLQPPAASPEPSSYVEAEQRQAALLKAEQEAKKIASQPGQTG